MIAISSLIGDKIKGRLIQLEKNYQILSNHLQIGGTFNINISTNNSFYKVSLTFGDKNSSSEKDKQSKGMQNLSLQSFHEAQIKIPIYDGIINAKRLDNWVDRLET